MSRSEKNDKRHTCYSSHMANLFGVDEENDIALRRVHIGILEQKHSVYTIFLEYGEPDKKPDRTSQVLAYDKILLTTNLRMSQSEWDKCLREIRSLTHAFKESQQIPTCLVLKIVGIRPCMGGHGTGSRDN